MELSAGARARMRRRDWGGSVLVACAVALAAFLHDHGVAVVLLGGVAAAAACVVIYDVVQERRAGSGGRSVGLMVALGIVVLLTIGGIAYELAAGPSNEKPKSSPSSKLLPVNP